MRQAFALVTTVFALLVYRVVGFHAMNVLSFLPLSCLSLSYLFASLLPQLSAIVLLTYYAA